MTRFLVVGGLILLLNNAIVVMITEFVGLHYLLSIICTTVVMTLLAFVLNRQWTFRKDGAIDWREMTRYLTGAAWNLIVAMVLTWGLVRVGLPYYIAGIVVAVVLAPVNFILHRQWSFGLGRRMGSPPRAN